MTRSLRMDCFQPTECVTDACRHGRAGSLGGGAIGSGAATKPACRGELTDERVALGDDAVGLGRVPSSVGRVELPIELEHAPPVSGEGRVVDTWAGATLEDGRPRCPDQVER